MIAPMNDQARGVRTDIWLWAARFYKTRSLAKHAIEGGKVEVNGLPCKPAKPIHPGDRLRVVRGEERFELQVIELSEKRGPAAIAATLYRESDASRAAREAQREQRRNLGSTPGRPPTRPDKKSRRLIKGFKDSL
jgi:ribosome-associated heat shock protein Hsp15